MKKNSLLCVFYFLFFQINLFAQEYGFKLPDTLKNKQYGYFSDRIQANERDTLKAIYYIDTWLKKAKNEKNLKEIVNAFHKKIYFSKEKLWLQYADSALAVATQTKDNTFIGKAYSVKANQYYFVGNYENALDFYLAAIRYVNQTEDNYLKYYLKFNVANIKFHLEFYEEALPLFAECAAFFKQSNEFNYQQGYLTNLHSIGLCHTRMGNYEKATQTNAFALKEAQKIGDTSNIPYLKQADGINEYFKKNYEVAIREISQTEIDLAKVSDFAMITIGHFYTGKSYWDLGEKEKAIPYFKKVDEQFEKTNYMRPDFREGFELLVNHYKEKGEVINQLFYINRLIKADSVLNISFKNISQKMHKEYDTKALLLEKQNAENKLARHQILVSILYVAVGLLFLFSIYFSYRFYTAKKQFKTKLDSFLNKEKPANQIVEPNATPPKKQLEINPEVIENILKQLDKFETKRNFLKKDITLVSLAKDFETNSNYLSKVIQHSRDKNFANYLSDLRIGYITPLMQSETRYRNYTIKALADEAGFSTPQHFSKAFFATHGFYPSFYLSELGSLSA